MLGSTVLEVAIGLTFCYGTVALIVSTLQEALAAAFRLRANTLLAGVKSMLNDSRFDGLARAVYQHPLVNPHADGTQPSERDMRTRPSYIEPAHFAIALVDSLWKVPGDFAQLGNAIETIPDPQVRQVMRGLYGRARDLQQFQDMLAGWFDNAMARMSGAYKRRQLLISLLLALLLAILFNIDSIHLFRTLWQQPALAAHLHDAPGALDPAVFDALMALPIGWTRFPPVANADFALQVAGWIVTASTALFGAPFWFDLMQRVVRMRSTGTRPEETPLALRVEGRIAATPVP
ncbi:hypothetical protein ASD28_27800 [Massilia sp. Root133]|uniref:hypothetical protein n=1 Tax=unclassified Massilia TaxID=2609279 RepID=UPI0006F86664|nr:MULTISPECIES: hypothetical protein [unclassified Massilia]KQY12392.1 hypothetical protein ASD28_27800 [Massilia sp. Root133]KQZ41052.1 hypothetical protein ASD92_30465 [Massilia sp. Root1485]